MSTILKKMQEANWLEVEAQVSARIRYLADVSMSYDVNDPDEARLGEKVARDLVVPCVDLLAKFCAGVQLPAVPEVPGPPIGATVHSDDLAFKTELDVSAWFAQAEDESIIRLARIDWGGDEPSDRVAEFYDGKDVIITEMFRYLERINEPRNRNTVGFECHVDRDSAMEWLAENRPYLAKQILEEEAS